MNCPYCVAIYESMHFTAVLRFAGDWWTLGRLKRSHLTKFKRVISVAWSVELRGLSIRCLPTKKNKKRCREKWHEKYVTSWKKGKKIINYTSDRRRSISQDRVHKLQPHYAMYNIMIFRHFCFASIIIACNHFAEHRLADTVLFLGHSMDITFCL